MKKKYEKVKHNEKLEEENHERWRCLSKLHCHISVKRDPKGQKVKGLDLLDLSMATIWYTSIVSIGFIVTFQTKCVR